MPLHASGLMGLNNMMLKCFCCLSVLVRNSFYALECFASCNRTSISKTELMITSNREKDMEETNQPERSEASHQETPAVLRDRSSAEQAGEQETDKRTNTQNVKEQQKRDADNV
jgi:hypothetical protein